MQKFQSTLPARGATAAEAATVRPYYFNPRSPHGERRPFLFAVRVPAIISIHAPRTGSDVSVKRRWLSAWHFNPRSPHGERRSIGKHYHKLNTISIHAPRTGSDAGGKAGGRGRPKFQSTLPARGATGYDARSVAHACISIHAPRTGSDLRIRFMCLEGGISIHAPRTGSDGNFLQREIHKIVFQSTLPARGATITVCLARTTSPFQSTLPARGATMLGLWLYR